MIDLATIVKAYDVRGTVPDELNATVAHALGRAFALVVGGSSMVAGHDMRESGPELLAAFAAGAGTEGMEVIDIGLASTDLLYFASGHLDLPGAMFTASHNPARYNGIKMCRPGAQPIGADTGLIEIRKIAQDALGSRPSTATTVTSRPSRRNLLGEYASFLAGLVDLTAIRPLRVVVDAGNGMAGYTVPAVLGQNPHLDIVPLYFELDGNFPNHEANPLEPANLVDLQKAVVEHHGDIGLAFDGDADRCFFIDATGAVVSPSAVTALVAARELAKSPGSVVIHNLITSKAVAEVVRENGGVPVRTRVGHSYIKAEMARTNAVFGGEHSAHYYFRDFWRADTGMLAAMHVLAALGGSDQDLAQLTTAYNRYHASGEINSTVTDATARTADVRRHYAAAGATFDELDGLTIELPGGDWLNVRASNTEPLLRLNVEAASDAAMQQIRDEALGIIRAGSQ